MTPAQEEQFLTALGTMQHRIFETQVSKGFWPQEPFDRNLGEALMLIVSELGEWLEGVRKESGSSIPNFTNEEEEAADVFIRLLDLCGGRSIRLGPAVLAKLKHNLQRPHKHGKAF